MVVLCKQSRDSLFFLCRIKGPVGNLVEIDRRLVQRPEHRSNVPSVIDPRAQPGEITTRHKFSGHLSVSRRKGLEDMKHTEVANGPGNQNQTERQRKHCTEVCRPREFVENLLSFLVQL